MFHCLKSSIRQSPTAQAPNTHPLPGAISWFHNVRYDRIIGVPVLRFVLSMLKNQGITLSPLVPGPEAQKLNRRLSKTDIANHTLRTSSTT